MGTRHLTRRMAVQALYALDMNKNMVAEEAIDSALAERTGPKVDVQLLGDLVRGTVKRMEELDPMLQATSKHWRVDRMDCLDRAILRLSIFELVHRKDMPAQVVLSEAVELAKTFGTDDSPSFINGILDRIAKDQRADEFKSS